MFASSSSAAATSSNSAAIPSSGGGAAAASGTADFRTRVAVIDGQVNFDAFQMRNGAVPVAIGVEYRDDDFDQDFP